MAKKTNDTFTLPATPPSQSFRTRKRDGAELQKKGYWIDADVAYAFEVWCVTQRRDESQVVTELLRAFLAKQK
jgi:hypothetical protein